jgi:hypothetical protein
MSSARRSALRLHAEAARASISVRSRADEPHASTARARRTGALWLCMSLSTFELWACAHANVDASLARAERGASPRLETQVAELEALTREAREHGAYRCAPEELARSEAHLEFAKRELDQGDRSRAREHLVLVSANARAALRLSGDAGCTAPSPSAPEARSRVGSRGELTNNTARLTQRRGSTKEHVAI